jgi:uncharacterized protein YyaL (SSP411 family)
MRVDGGGFAASLDADSGGEEGAFYTWDRSEIESVIGPEAVDQFFTVFELSSPPNWEGKPILHRRPDAPQPTDVGDALQKLLARRETRVRPGRDDKVLADWNGLAITALAEASRSLQRPDWLETAQRAYRFVRDSSDAAGLLPHSILAERRLFPGMSSDYAAMANAAIALYEATGQDSFVDDAVRFLAVLDDRYADESKRGHYLTAAESADVPIRIRGDVDEAIASATAQIIEAYARVATATGRMDLYERAWELAKAATGRIRSQPYGQAGIVNACSILEGSRKLVIVEDAAAPLGLAEAALGFPDLRRVDLVLPLGTDSVELPGGVMPDMSRSAAWLCIGQACLPPITDPAELATTLGS